jgi:hypothetical protein
MTIGEGFRNCVCPQATYLRDRGLKQAITLLFLILLVASAQASDALILIQPAVAASHGAPSTGPPLWVLWPTETFRAGHSALLSLVTGEDWLGDNHDSEFVTLGHGRIVAENGQAMQRRGVFVARARFLPGLRTFALPGPQRSLRETTLLLCVEGPTQPIRILEPQDSWPENGLVVHEALSWADVNDVARRVSRALVVEYPPPAGQPWTRYWLAGKGWPGPMPGKGASAFPGLTAARSALNLLTSPNRFRWVAESRPDSVDTPLWLAMVRYQAPAWRTGFGFALALLLSVGLLLALRERRSVVLPELLQVMLLSPAGAVLGGGIARMEGVQALPVCCAVSIALVSGISKLGQVLLMRWVPDAHRLLAPALVSWMAFTFSNPLWSPLSGVFAPDGALSVAAYGCWFASMVAACGFVRGASLTAEWLMRIAILATIAACFVGSVWWAPTVLPYALLPAVALAFGDGCWRRSLAPGLPILGALTTPGLLYGVAWKQGGLLSRAGDAHKLNGAEYVQFVISPICVGTVAMVFLFSLMADRFLLHQYRKLVAEDPRRLAVLSGSGGLALVGLTQPSLLPAALWAAIGGLTILVMDGLSVL